MVLHAGPEFIAIVYSKDPLKYSVRETTHENNQHDAGQLLI